MKEETRIEGPWEFGNRPFNRNNKQDWNEIRTLAKQNKLDNIPAEVYVRHYFMLRQIGKDH